MRAAVTILAFCVAAMLALGMVMLYSSSMVQSGAHYLMMQLVWGGLGLLFCFTAATLDYRWLKHLAWPLLGVAVVLLALVLVDGVGLRVKGARRWLGLGELRFQPSELAKLALIIVLAWYGERFQRHMSTFTRGVAIPGAVIALVLGLIFVEPDRGSTVLLAAVSCAMLLVAGVRWKLFLPPVCLAAAALVVSLIHDPVRARRIFGWLNLEEHKTGVSYQAYQAMLALGAGGVDGLGLGNGRQKTFVPEHHTDFILSMIGEELGFVGTLMVVLAFMAIFICGIYISVKSSDTFGMLLGCGLSFLIGLQAFINIGVVTSTLPNKGLPLPFISYGGSNLLVMLTSVGLLFSIARRARSAPETGVLPSSAGEIPAAQMP